MTTMGKCLPRSQERVWSAVKASLDGCQNLVLDLEESQDLWLGEATSEFRCLRSRANTHSHLIHDLIPRITRIQTACSRKIRRCRQRQSHHASRSKRYKCVCSLLVS